MPHVTLDGIDGEQLFAQYRIESDGRSDRHIVDIIDQRYGTWYVEVLGDESRDDIDLVVASDGDRGIHIGDALDGQEIVVGAIALDDQYVFEPVGYFPGFFGTAFYQLDSSGW